MAYAFSMRRKVEFAETDMAGIVHFSNFFRYMEVTEASFYRSLGFSVVSRDGSIGWPRVHASCDYVSPLRFEDEVEIRLLVHEKRTRSVAYLFQIHRMNGESSVLAARGRITIVCVRPKPGGGMEACAIPDYFHSKIEEAPAEARVGWIDME